jgi:hypothetical protein
MSSQSSIESAVLSSCLVGASAQVLAHCHRPLVQWFSTDRSRRIAAAIDACLERNEEPNETSVAMALEQAGDHVVVMPEVLQDLVINGMPSQGGPAARALRHVCAVRHAQKLLRDAGQSLSDAGIGSDPAAVIEAHIAQLRSLDMGGGSDINLGAAALQAIDAGIERAKYADGRRATWGLAALDALLPLEPGRLYILAAAPKAGKTSLALQAALHTADANWESGGRVAMASLEMRADEVANILVAQTCNIPAGRVREGGCSVTELEVLREVAEEWKKRDAVWLRDAGTAQAGSDTCASILAWLQFRQQASGNRMCMAIIDYLQLLAPVDPRATEYATISANTRMLKRAAQRLRIPLVVLCQMNREGRKQTHGRDGEVQGQVEPTLGALRGSGSIEQDADAVLFLHCPQPPVDHKAPRLVRATVAASRFCAPGSTDLVFYGTHQRFCPGQNQEVEEARNAGAAITSEQRESNAEDAASAWTGSK